MEWAVLGGMEAGDRRRLLEGCVRRRFGRNEVIFHESDPGDTIHLIDRGRVAVRVTTPLGDVATLAILGPGDFFGELALLLPLGRRTASAVALDDVETRAMARDVFEALRRAHPAVGAFLMNALALDVQRLSAHLVDALYVPADRRVLRRLVEVLKVYGAACPGGSVAITQDDLASLAGTTRPTVNRVLRQAQQAGLLALARGCLTVVDYDGLVRKAR